MFKFVTITKNLAISLGIGILSGLLISGKVGIYEKLNLPKFAPPSGVFPVAWTILYILMGISSYLVYRTKEKPGQKRALRIYYLQLLVNFLWPIFFFNFRLYGFSFFWLVILLAIVAVMDVLFFKIRPSAAYLQIPYFLWLCYAIYLNYMVWSLN
jgi:tryptophan-rich sensory protein